MRTNSWVGTSRVGMLTMVALALLAGCGDGDGAGPRATPTATQRAATATPSNVPPSATASATIAAPTRTATQPAATATTTPLPPSPTPTASASPTPTASASATPSQTATATATATLVSGEAGPVAPLAGAGRWFIDSIGRVVLFHGVNMVAKRDPYYPSSYGFADDDIAFLVEHGFNAVRLGIDFRGLMPTPGVVETDYIEHIAETVDALVRRDVFVLLDFHQDGFAPIFNGNGFPDWLAISDGLPNPPDAVFPLYYIQNPAMQRAFENFWANRAGPNDIGLQDYFAQGVAAVAARFADEPLVLGTELMNEPWPGSVYMPCIMAPTGCPDLEQQLLVPFYRKGGAAARQQAPTQFVFVEPFVLFNFGQAPTSLPGSEDGFALSYHSYALDEVGERAVAANGVAAAERDGAPVALTEFGASTDPVLLNRLATQFEEVLVPWFFWSYDETVMKDLQEQASLDHVTSLAAFDTLVRPYPVATAGTPDSISFDPTSAVFSYSYLTAPPSGVNLGAAAVTVLSIPDRHYAGGYTVTIDGATVTSAPDARLLTLRNDAGASHVTVSVVPVAAVP
jgi:endoglycosylceramidase